jgi:hypothetical protein
VLRYVAEETSDSRYILEGTGEVSSMRSSLPGRTQKPPSLPDPG